MVMSCVRLSPDFIVMGESLFILAQYPIQNVHTCPAPISLSSWQVSSFQRPVASPLCKPCCNFLPPTLFPLHHYRPHHPSVSFSIPASFAFLDAQTQWEFLPDIGREAYKHFLHCRQPGLPTLPSAGSPPNTSLQPHILCTALHFSELGDCILFPMVLEPTPTTCRSMLSVSYLFCWTLSHRHLAEPSSCTNTHSHMDSVRSNTEPDYTTQEATQRGGAHGAFLPHSAGLVILFQWDVYAHTQTHSAHTLRQACTHSSPHSSPPFLSHSLERGSLIPSWTCLSQDARTESVLFNAWWHVT